MVFKSTLERESEKLRGSAQHMRDTGIEVPKLVLEVNKMVSKSAKFSYTLDEAVDVAKTIQPSITEEDCRIAVCLQLTLCSQLIYNLIEEGKIKIAE